ncbi:MAG: hypothetical protein GY853_00775 [PVC group bacterium]|nr:hypothetical protein [PVC group bacterium]
MNNGEITASVGEKLTNDGYNVFYDHGDAKKNKNVRACLALLKKPAKNEHRLSDVDIVVCKEKKVKAIIEIEESSFSPKTILGNILTMMLTKYVAIKKHHEEQNDDEEHDYYDVDKGTFKLIFGIFNPNGKKKEQVKDNLELKLKDLFTKIGTDQIPKLILIKDEDDIRSEIIKVIKTYLNPNRNLSTNGS